MGNSWFINIDGTPSLKGGVLQRVFVKKSLIFHKIACDLLCESLRLLAALSLSKILDLITSKHLLTLISKHTFAVKKINCKSKLAKQLKPQSRKVDDLQKSKTVGIKQINFSKTSFLSNAKTIKDGLQNRLRFTLRIFAPFGSLFLAQQNLRPYYKQALINLGTSTTFAVNKNEVKIYPA